MRKRPNLKTTPPPAGPHHPGLRETPDVVKHAPLVWGLERVDFEGEWGWLNLDRDDIHGLHRELVKLEGETLEELLKTQRIKDIPAQHMVRGARARLELLGLHERDTLWELRLRGKRRAWGLVEGAVFYFLWWDPRETACNPPPRGTRRRRARP